ncbi:SIMPL domain-containing protein [Sphingomonas sp. SM33]|uniref:SIMPL domain-containing protein n=1 Tax=Sphingomonas telluris TaxID=2907998 RepID=A0ABS9VQT5_9SPHN|nr:SIMPL domain-containing protein [Sphingomonas telluris]MCH8617318.1 SIMPL domain-containing protein [Sphingomonas telluris]
MKFATALAICAAAVPAAAQAQAVQVQVPPIAGTSLEVSATGEVTRVPDVAVISAGVVTRSQTASAALQQNAARMDGVIAALKAAGVAERDIQTSSISLNPEYRYVENQAPKLTGYSASNSVNIRFRDIRNSGKVLDALVAEGANQINGPTLTIDKPEAALDEARANAIANGRARAELYARALGKRVARVVSISESGRSYPVPPPMPVMMEARAQAADTKIVPGDQKLEVTVSMVFDLQ